MGGPSGSSPRALSLLRDLEAKPYRFELFQALRLLECYFPERPRLGTSVRPVEDAVRLGQEPSLAFAPASLASFQPAGSGPAHLRTFAPGLFGPHGALPIHLTEHARDRIRNHDDETFAAFADLFHHRILSLFYRAWADAQPTVAHDRPASDRFATYIGSLFGLGLAGHRDRDAAPDLAKLHHAGLFGGGTRHPDGLASILSDYFDVPVAVEEFVGGWMEIPRPDRMVLGLDPANGTLGVTATIGSHTYGCQQAFRLVFGPTTLEQYERVLPGQESLARLVALVRQYTGDELAWDLTLVLRHDEVPGVELGTRGRLGYTSWIGRRSGSIDADDLTFDPSTLDDWKASMRSPRRTRT